MNRIQRMARWRLAGIQAYGRAWRATNGWDRDQRVTGSFRDELPVIMCTWKRTERLSETIAMLADQDIPVQLIIWNNSPNRDAVDRAVADAPIPVTVHHSPWNIGGFGRFYLAREASLAGHDTVVFIDDDLDFGPESVSKLIADHRHKSLTGWFAFSDPAPAVRHEVRGGEAARYVGTGGMAADSRVFRDPRLFGCPRRFWFVEDAWLCAFARHAAGYELRGSDAKFAIEVDGRDQCHTLGMVKHAQRRWLARKGMAL